MTVEQPRMEGSKTSEPMTMVELSKRTREPEMPGRRKIHGQ
jgi:hypothetical protein